VISVSVRITRLDLAAGVAVVRDVADLGRIISELTLNVRTWAKITRSQARRALT
jgi:hypothetical protein